jgi:hypothetical protein
MAKEVRLQSVLNRYRIGISTHECAELDDAMITRIERETESVCLGGEGGGTGTHTHTHTHHTCRELTIVHIPK